MDLMNKEVTHKSFGKGSIVDCNEAYVVVKFKTGNKEFVYPDAFDNYLTLVDKKTADSVDKILEKLETEREIEEQRIEEEKAIELEEQQRLLRIEKLKKHKIHSSSQVAFNCRGEELDTVFSEWGIFTGTIKSGVNEGKTNKLIRVLQNTACLITAKDSGAPEKERYIKGLFMVDDGFAGRLCEDGFMPAHPDYRIKLSEEESKRMPFWKYYVNERYPDNMTWSGRYRYFANAVMAGILKDILSLINDREDHCQEIFDYFCLINQIDEKDIAEPDGPLTRIK